MSGESGRLSGGSLSHLIRIEYESGTTRSAIGEPVLTWATFASVWASVEPLRGNEAIALRMQGAEISTRIRTRYIPGVKPSMRVVHGDDIYNIHEAYSPFERKRELEMLCSRESD